MSRQSCDTLIIGGGIIGLATAYALSRQGQKVTLVERKYLGSGSTGRCIGGLRQQFSTAASIGLMQENMALFAGMAEEFGHSVEFKSSGYLLLAHSEQTWAVFQKNVALQQSMGVDVRLLSPAECLKVTPQLCTEDLIGGAHCPSDGQAFPFAVLRGYRRGIEQGGGRIITQNPVLSIENKRPFFVHLKDGTALSSDQLVVATGPWTAELMKGIGLDLPLYPERHEAVISERMPAFLGPMLVDYRPDGCYFQQLESGQIIGCYTPYPHIPGIHEDVSFDFLPQVARRMTRLVPALEHVSLLRHWSGSYTVTPDGNPIVDESPIPGLFIAAGMCGHGFMLAPAIGRHLALRMTTGKWQRDFSEFAMNRAFSGQETLK
jgi:sarcosine oxidase subunit beta